MLKFGVYLNTKTHKAMRINSPYFIPSGEEWTLVTEDVNCTLIEVRRLARDKRLVNSRTEVGWGDWASVR